MKKRIKIHTHHFLSIALDYGKKIKEKESIFFRFFYQIGNVLVIIITAPFKLFRGTGKFLSRQGSETSKSIKYRFKIIRSKDFARSLLLFLVLCSLGWGFLKGAGLLASALDFKNNIFSGTEAGITHLNQAQQALADKNMAEANSQFALAYNNFEDGKRQIDEGSTLMSSLLKFLPQTKQARNALDAAGLISTAGTNLSTFYSLAATLSFSPQGLESNQDITVTVTTMGESLNKASEEISEANLKLKTVDSALLPAAKREEFAQLKNKLGAAQVALANMREIFNIAQQLIIPKNNILVLFENNNELRPGGGFIGTFGTFNIEGGKISQLNISSIYDLDGQLKEKISPPDPLLAVNDRWFLRDSNWFADFPTSARKALEFYESEGGQTPGTIISLTPDVIVNLLKITGSVFIPSFNVTLDASNFLEQTQAISTISDNMPLNTPKQILADFFPVFLQKLKTLTPEQQKLILAQLFWGLQHKQMALYSQSADMQSQIESFNWAGKIFDSDRDYLQIVSGNLGGTKTDLSLQKNISLKTSIGQDGKIINDLTLTVTNQMPKMEGTQNSSFVRFLVPQGSKLLTVTGFDAKNLEGLKNKDYKSDPSVELWQKGMVKDVASGTYIGTESGKTFFGNWLNVEGGQTRTIHLVYQLPQTLEDLDRYSLTLQKQMGSQSDKFQYTIKFPGKKLQWESFVPQTVEANSLEVSGLINADMFFGLVLQNR